MEKQIMQNQKKNLWLIALVGALTLAFASGCDNESASKKKEDEDKEEKQTKNAKVHEIKKVKKHADFVDSDSIGGIEESRDGKFGYFMHDGTGVRAFEVT